MHKTPEEIFNQQVWELLQEIKEEFLATVKGKPIKYRVPNIIGAGIISADRQKKILYKLEEEGAFKIQRNESGQRIGTSDIFYLILDYVKFGEIYKKYEKQNKLIEEKSPTNKGKDELIDIPLTDLENKFNEIESEQDLSKFYMKIADYGKYLLDHNEISSLIKPLYEQSKKDSVEFELLSKKFYKEWKILAKDLLEKAKKNGIVDNPKDPFSNEIGYIKTRLNEASPPIDDNYLGQYYLPYWTLAKKLIDRFGSEIIKNHLIYHDKDYEYKLFDIKSEAESSWIKFKNLREIQIWWAHFQIMRLTYGVFEPKEKDPYYDSHNIIESLYRYEFEQISHGKRDGLILLKQKNFLDWIKRLHNYLLPRLKISENVSRMVSISTPTFIPDISYFQKDFINLKKIIDNFNQNLIQTSFPIVNYQKQAVALAKSLQPQIDSINNLTETIRKSIVLPKINLEVIKDIERSMENLNKIRTSNRLIVLPQSFNVPKNNDDDKYELIHKQQNLIEQLIGELKEIKNKATSQTQLENSKSSIKMTKRVAKQEINKIIKIGQFGKKEKKFLQILADLEPIKIKRLTNDIPTEDCKHLKAEVQKKLENTQWSIKTYKQKGLETDSFYELIYLPEKKTD